METISDETYENLEEWNLATAEFEGCRFVNCRFLEAGLGNCRFIDCRFEHCDLSLAVVTGARFRTVTFHECKAVGVNWAHSSGLVGVRFEGCKLDNASLAGLDLRHACFKGSSMAGVDFQQTRLDQADLSGTRLQGAIFLGTSLVKADLRGAEGYCFDPRENKLKGTLVSAPEALALLEVLGLKISP